MKFSAAWIFWGLFFSLAAVAVDESYDCPGHLTLKRRTLLANYSPLGQGGVPVAFIDVDKTLVVSTQGHSVPSEPGDITWLPGTVPVLSRLNEENIFLALVSNQKDTPVFPSWENTDAVLLRVVEHFQQMGVKIHWFDFAGGGEQNARDRKPNPGMGLRLERFLQITYARPLDRSRSFMVGDYADKDLDGSDSDLGFARAFGIGFRDPSAFFGWSAQGVRRFGKPFFR